MLTMGDVNAMIGAWAAELMVKYPKHAIRWSAMAGDDAYKFKCPGWVVIVAPRAWKKRWDALPEPRSPEPKILSRLKIPELGDAEFKRFMEEWVRHMQAASVTRDPNPYSG